MSEKKKASTETALTVAQQKAVAMFAPDAGTGFEETTSADYAVPFLKLLQKGSPEVDRDDGAYVEGALPGMYVDSATKEVFEELTFIPCYYHRAMVEWHDVDSGGGFVAQHPVGYEEKFPRDDRGRWKTGEDTYLADTRYFFGLRVAPDGGVSPGVVSMASSQIKKARNWMAQLQAQKIMVPDKDGNMVAQVLPIFANSWKFTSVPEENEKGSWRGYKVDRIGLLADDALVGACRDARKMFAGAAAGFRPPDESATAAPAGSAGGDTVPF
jgi:hypothetical protein